MQKENHESNSESNQQGSKSSEQPLKIGQQALRIPDPVYYNTIQFSEDGVVVSYTDCWQISVLRFLHLIFGQRGTINFTKLTHLMDLENVNCKRLMTYFQLNPTYHEEEEFYTTQKGFLIRAQWAQFLNRAGLFYLKRNEGKHQVAATMPNLIAFYKGYFPKLSLSRELEDLTYENIRSNRLFESYQIVLSEIYSQFSKISQIDLKLQLRTDLNSQQDQMMMQMIYFSTVQVITVNKFTYPQLEWQIYEYYDLVGKMKVGSRTMGHSDYRYSKEFKQNMENQEKK